MSLLLLFPDPAAKRVALFSEERQGRPDPHVGLWRILTNAMAVAVRILS